MDARFPITRDDLYNLQMEVKQVQYTQSSHAERLLRLEKRNADDSALKSVWNSPFPGVLGGTPHQGPVQIPHNDVFDDLDEQGEELLGSLHLGPAEEEPVRRGAASRANSVRFDESALHGSSWGGQSYRQSEEFGAIRPGSGLMLERSLSHKSDGRHSSAGHSIHSHHSVASGRASSLGLDNNYAAGDGDVSSFDIPGPPASLYVLGSVPSIIRCWLTTNFAHRTLLYADVCTGSQKSIVESSLLKELDLLEEVERDSHGVFRIRLNVYLAEAVVTRHENRNTASNGAVPSMAVMFEVSGSIEPTKSAADHKGIRIYIGSDALRAHSADVLFSQNTMILYGVEQERLRVPFVRPEDENLFRNICTSNTVPGKPRLNANATPFVLRGLAYGQATENGTSSRSTPPQAAAGGGGGGAAAGGGGGAAGAAEDDRNGLDTRAASPRGTREQDAAYRKSDERPTMSEQGGEMDGGNPADMAGSEHSVKDGAGSMSADGSRRESSASTGIWGSWRHNSTGPASDGTARETGNLSGYQPAGRSSRNMKVLKPLKSSSHSTAKASTAAYEPWQPAPAKPSNNGRRKSQASLNGDGGGGGVSVLNRWDVKRSISSGAELKTAMPRREDHKGVALPRSTNPVGVASAFSWMTPTTTTTKSSKSSATIED
ncbi:hypothetical protein E4U43_003437 [Claviceps pusilla]|uniref:Ubiquitin carboxyl-terminal hydrolase 19 n=1 Tax=Claviceps pusilla TaxID=123648 RepID=A0A9P7N5Z5_9HYPO|nr:hypothetical protein E4U43_003437 [Claviceps pusilla]